MKYCSKCGKEASGKFCANCGHKLEKKELKMPAFLEKSWIFVKNNKKRVAIWSSLVAVCLAGLITFIAIYFNIFRIGKVSRIDIGMSEKKVERILGKPTEEKNNYMLWVGKDAEKITKKMSKLEAELEEAFEKGDEDKIEDLTEELFELEEKLEEAESEYIEVYFDDGKVTSVYFEPADYNEKAKASVKILKAPKSVMEGTTAVTVVYEEEQGGAYHKSSTKVSLTYAEDWESASYSFASQKFGANVEKTCMVKELKPFTEGDFTYEVNKGALVLSECENKDIQSVVIPNTVIYKDMEFTVNWIGSSAFANCRNLTSVVIGDSVTGIWEDAFADCDKLIEVYNKSSLKITAGEVHFGYVGYYALNVYTPTSGASKLSTDDSGYLIYTDGDDKLLVGYTGTETALTLPSDITAIHQYAFYNCDKLMNMTIPDSITSIGRDAFYGCDNLQYTEQNGLKYLGNERNKYLCLVGINTSNATTAIVQENCRIIASCVFNNCSGLTNVVIPDSVTSIEWAMFSGCSSLTSITIPSVGKIESPVTDSYVLYPFGYIFGTSYYTGGKATRQPIIPLMNYIDFYIPISLKSVTVKGGFISSDAFYNCSGLTSVTIGENVTGIGSSAFYGCSGLTGITVSENNTAYKSIDGNLYSKDGTTLIQYAMGKTATTFTIPDSVTSIGNRAFYNCSSLTSVTIPDSVTSIGNYAFCNCGSLTSVTIGDSVTRIGKSAFYGCDSLTSVEIGDSVTSIDDYAFYNCESLTSVVIPDSITSIGKYAFEYCRSLMSIEIPDGVTSIGEMAFDGCSSLTSITFEGTVAEWNAIEKGIYWNYNVPATKVVCKDGEVSI